MNLGLVHLPTRKEQLKGQGGCPAMAAKPGQGSMRARKDEMCLLTMPPTFQEMLGRGCPEASQDRFNIVFSCTCIFLSFNTTHGGPGEAANSASLFLPPPTPAIEQSRVVSGFMSSKNLKHPTWGGSKGHLICAQRASPKIATLTSCVEFRPGTVGTDATQR